MNRPPTLIVVHGPPASGKTELGRFLAQELQMPMLMKDEIKETLFAHFNHASIVESDRLDAPSVDLLWLWLDTVMSPRQGHVLVETAFDATSQVQLTQLAQRHRFEMVQVYCHATEAVLRQRYIERAQTTNRHPGHLDLARVEGQPIPEHGSYHPLELAGPLIVVDTSDPQEVNYQAILQEVRDAL